MSSVNNKMQLELFTYCPICFKKSHCWKRKNYWLFWNEKAPCSHCIALKQNRHKRLRYIRSQARKRRIKRDPIYRIKLGMRSRMKKLIKAGKAAPIHSHSIGCNSNQLKAYLESKFLVGMTWDNKGFYGWHIDHIKPLSAFNLLDPIDKMQANHYTNLQPLWAKDNLKKHAKYVKSI